MENNNLKINFYAVGPNASVFRVIFIVFFIYLTLNFISYYRKSKDRNFLYPALFFGTILFSLGIDEFNFWARGLYTYYPNNAILAAINSIYERSAVFTGNVLWYILIFSLAVSLFKFKKIRRQYKLLKESKSPH